MAMFMRLLRDAAQKHGLCILVRILTILSSLTLSPLPFGGPCEAKSNADESPSCPQVLNDATAASRPALGPSFTFMSDATLWLARSPGQEHEVRTAEVLRSRISVRSCLTLWCCLFVDDVSLRKAAGPRCAFRIRDGRVMAT